MYLKKNATVLISTVIILSLMSILGCSMFKMMKNNNELSTLYNFDKDIYDLDKDEEEILNEFMEQLNQKQKDKLSNQNTESVFLEGFTLKIGNSSLEYNKNNNKIFLITHKDNEIIRTREITYIFSHEKIILIPTFKFVDKSSKNV